MSSLLICLPTNRGLWEDGTLRPTALCSSGSLATRSLPRRDGVGDTMRDDRKDAEQGQSSRLVWVLGAKPADPSTSPAPDSPDPGDSDRARQDRWRTQSQDAVWGQGGRRPDPLSGTPVFGDDPLRPRQKRLSVRVTGVNSLYGYDNVSVSHPRVKRDTRGEQPAPFSCSGHALAVPWSPDQRTTLGKPQGATPGPPAGDRVSLWSWMPPRRSPRRPPAWSPGPRR